MSVHAVMGRAKHPEDCSCKDCVCGGHFASDVKKNLNNHATRARLNYRLQSMFKAAMNGRSFTKDEANRYHDSLIALSTPTGRKIEI